ncbi:MAG TPA: Ada metal-binding domain-containing protein [Cytophagales bacterium]|nr:Ada metal-binding domain-containing protein [Cytophagales bacterium]
MIKHEALGINHFKRSRKLKHLLNQKEILFGGNINLRIYGLMSCTSGKRMKVQNRVFFKSQEEARDAGFRPCANCMKDAYLAWKTGVDKLRHK